MEEPGVNSRRGQALTRGPFPRHPFYIWVGAPSLSQGRKVVRALLDFSIRAKLESIAFEAAPGNWHGWRIAPDLHATDLISTDSEQCRNGDLISDLQIENDEHVRIVVEQHSKAKWTFGATPVPVLGFSLPVQEASEPDTTTLPLINVNQEITTDNPFAHLESKIEKATARDRVLTYLSICLKYEGSLAVTRLGKAISLMARWRAERSTDSFWRNWSSDTDDDPKSLDKTVNLDMFLRLLGSELSGQSDPAVLTTDMLTIQYEK